MPPVNSFWWWFDMTAGVEHASLIQALEHRFRQVQMGMADLPFLNPCLQVQAVGFQPWQSWWLGVLITPWFMNFVLLPRAGESSPEPVGTERAFDFPCGRFTFICGRETGLGQYWSCSLLSPVQEVNSQHEAEAIARASLQQLLAAGVDAGTGSQRAPAPDDRVPPRRALLRRMLGQSTTADEASSK